MRVASLRQALWHRHVNAVAPAAAMRAWLTAGGSLTARLVAHSGAFRVQRLHQRTALCLADEAAVIGMGRPGRVWEREVLLRCDERPVVFAHTVVPMAASATDWPLFNALGERSLGSTLFYDPLVRRGALEFARLRAGHPLALRARAALGDPHAPHDQSIYYARRCLYRRHQGSLLVTEVFLPAVIDLIAAYMQPQQQRT
ncbi:MAG: chorismate lyase [Pseudomonadota bacterium]|nr:chorismate lyase [Pseudomonadota bacterium]